MGKNLIMGSKFDGSKGPPAIEGMTSLKVDNLTYRTTMEDLERYFRKYGEIGDIYIPRDRNTHESRGFAFVRYYESRDAEDGMDGKAIDGREIRVALARYGRPTTQHNPRNSQGGSDYRGGGYRERGGYRGGYSNQRRYSPRRRSRSRSRSNSRSRRRSRSLSRSPRYRARSLSRSPVRPSRSPRNNFSRSRGRSRSRSRP